MTTLQQVVFEFDMDYAGHPYYVSGNAILHALAPDLSYEQQQALRVSHGVFAPAQFGKYPDEHSQAGTRPGMGSSLPPVECYSDLFLTRDPEQRWLLDSRARDALNTPSMKIQGERPIFGRETRLQKRSSLCVHAYLTAEDDSLLPLDEALLDGLQFGGARNYGYGTTRLSDTQTVDLDALSFDRVREADDHLLVLQTPYVLDSEHPHADDHTVPWWWDYDGRLRHRQEAIVEQRDRYRLQTVDHGQVVGYAGDNPVTTARNGLERIGTHSKYGFGELQVVPLGS